MKKLFQGLMDSMEAVAFAEAGELETAQKMIIRSKNIGANGDKKAAAESSFSKRFNTVQEAIAFAEAGELETAQSLLNNNKKSDGKVVDLSKAAAVPFNKKFDSIQEAITFAEVGEFDTARRIMKKFMKKRGASKPVQKTNTKSFSDRLETTTEAITFAESGEHAYAKELISQNEKERQKILVVGGEDGFSDMLVTYAVGMAKRMNYEIIAVNVVQVGKRIFNVLTETKATDEIEAHSAQGSESFKSKAEESEIPFTHEVKFGGFDKIVKEMHREIKRISFVLSEPSHVSKDTADSATHIPVFCLASGE